MTMRLVNLAAAALLSAPFAYAGEAVNTEDVREGLASLKNKIQNMENNLGNIKQQAKKAQKALRRLNQGSMTRPEFKEAKQSLKQSIVKTSERTEGLIRKSERTLGVLADLHEAARNVSFEAGGCQLFGEPTATKQCSRGVYAGPNRADIHWGTCLYTRGNCKVYSQPTITKRCGDGAYAGPNKVAEHHGSCVYADGGYKLRWKHTANKDCGRGTYAGPNRADLHWGVCLFLEKE